MTAEDLGTVRWFGKSWGAPVCDPRTHVPTPVGAPCVGHEHLHTDDRTDTIEPTDQGITLPYCPGGGQVRAVCYHLTCWLHEVGADRFTPTPRGTDQ